MAWIRNNDLTIWTWFSNIMPKRRHSWVYPTRQSQIDWRQYFEWCILVFHEGKENGKKSNQSMKALERSRSDSVGSWWTLMITSFRGYHGPVLRKRIPWRMQQNTLNLDQREQTNSVFVQAKTDQKQTEALRAPRSVGFAQTPGRLRHNRGESWPLTNMSCSLLAVHEIDPSCKRLPILPIK